MRPPQPPCRARINGLGIPRALDMGGQHRRGTACRGFHDCCHGPYRRLGIYRLPRSEEHPAPGHHHGHRGRRIGTRGNTCGRLCGAHTHGSRRRLTERGCRCCRSLLGATGSIHVCDDGITYILINACGEQVDGLLAILLHGALSIFDATLCLGKLNEFTYFSFREFTSL